MCLALRFNLEVAEPRDTRLYVNAVDIRVHATNGAIAGDARVRKKPIADALLPLQPGNFHLQRPPRTFDDVFIRPRAPPIARGNTE